MKLTRENTVTLLNAHLCVAVLLVLVNVVLLTRLVLAWNTLRTDSSEQIQNYQTSLKVLELQTAPLRGLPTKVETSRKEAASFYDRRMPANYSTITAELFSLEKKESVHTSRISYTQVPVLADLVEVRMDENLTGEYAPIMRYINGLERNKVFFLINGLTLAGQQGGNVNVRIKVLTYIHAADANSLQPPPDSGDSPSGGGDDSANTSASLHWPALPAVGGR